MKCIKMHVIRSYATPRAQGDIKCIRISLWNLVIIIYYVYNPSYVKKLMNDLGYGQLSNLNQSLNLLLMYEGNHLKHLL